MMTASFEAQEIRTFLVLAEELHYGRTAQRLLLTPSRVSQIIRRLETRIGGQLFTRTSRKVALSPLGVQLRRESGPAFRRVERALQRAHDAAGGLCGTVRLGMYTPANGGPHLIDIITAFRERYRNCDVAIIDVGLERDPVDWLRSKTIDVLAMRLPVPDLAVTTGPTLSVEDRVLAVSATHPLATREAIDWEDVADYAVSDVETMPRELIDCLAPPSTPSGRTLRRVNNAVFSQILTRVALGELVHPTVRSFADHHRHPGVVFVPIRDLPPSRTALGWIGNPPAPVIGAFIQTAQDVLDSNSPVSTTAGRG